MKSYSSMSLFMTVSPSTCFKQQTVEYRRCRDFVVLPDLAGERLFPHAFTGRDWSPVNTQHIEQLWCVVQHGQRTANHDAIGLGLNGEYPS